MKLKMIEEQLIKIEELRQKGEVRDLVHYAQNALIQSQHRETGWILMLCLSIIANIALLVEVIR